MLEKIAKTCFEFLHERACESNATDEVKVGCNDEEFHIQIGNGERYDVVVDDFSVHPDDDTDEGRKLDPACMCPTLSSDSDHTDILSACIAALAKSPICNSINDLTTDGDNHDCEVIFNVDGYGYVVLKVR